MPHPDLGPGGQLNSGFLISSVPNKMSEHYACDNKATVAIAKNLNDFIFLYIY